MLSRNQFMICTYHELEFLICTYQEFKFVIRQSNVATVQNLDVSQFSFE